MERLDVSVCGAALAPLLITLEVKKKTKQKKNPLMEELERPRGQENRVLTAR